MQRLDPSLGTSEATAEVVRAADHPSSSVRTAATIFSAQLSVVFLAIFVTGLTTSIALLTWNVWQTTPSVLNQMVSATKIVVFMDPTSTRRDAEAIVTRLQTLPGVKSARLRPKEELLSGMDAALRNALRLSGDISLPDAWELSLHASGGPNDAGLGSLASTAEQVQRAAMEIPGVESVRFDRLWLADLDRWIKALRDASKILSVSFFVAIFILMFVPFFLATRVLRNHAMVGTSYITGSNIKVFVYIGLFLGGLGAIATLLMYASAAVMLRGFVTHTLGGMQTWLGAAGQSKAEDASTVIVLMLASALTASLLAGRNK